MEGLPCLLAVPCSSDCEVVYVYSERELWSAGGGGGTCSRWGLSMRLGGQMAKQSLTSLMYQAAHFISCIDP
jgi:hypothetical protein